MTETAFRGQGAKMHPGLEPSLISTTFKVEMFSKDLIKVRLGEQSVWRDLFLRMEVSVTTYRAVFQSISLVRNVWQLVSFYQLCGQSVTNRLINYVMVWNQKEQQNTSLKAVVQFGHSTMNFSAFPKRRVLRSHRVYATSFDINAGGIILCITCFGLLTFIRHKFRHLFVRVTRVLKSTTATSTEFEETFKPS